MNIGQLARACNVSTGTLRYYEKNRLINSPARQLNGYRLYSEADVELIGFIRGAQALGFSLAEIREILPQLAEGTFDRTKIEHQLSMKVAQVDAHMNQLQTLKKELLATFALLKCTPNKVVSTADATAIDSGSGVGTEITRNTFSKQKKSSS